jgi:hypothetical protein
MSVHEQYGGPVRVTASIENLDFIQGMRKLVHISYGVYKDQRPYRPQVVPA